jgi:hypothetical protein
MATEARITQLAKTVIAEEGRYATLADVDRVAYTQHWPELATLTNEQIANLIEDIHDVIADSRAA